MLQRDSLDLPEPYVPPATPEERDMTGIWAREFDLDRVGMDDDFFDLGGDSLIAENLASAVEQGFGRNFAPSQLLDHGTPSRLLALVARKTAEDLPSNVVAVNASAPGDPIFFIHGAAGISFLRRPFVAALGGENPLYVFQAPGFDGKAPPPESVEQMAELYLSVMRGIAPRGRPWKVVTFCAGALIAVEIARRLEAEGGGFDRMIFVDPGTPHQARKDFRLRRNPLVRAGIPGVSTALASLGEAWLSNAEKFGYFLRTGSFTHGHDWRAFGANPRYRAHLLRLAGAQHARRRAPFESVATTADGGDDPYSQRDRSYLREIYGSEPAVLTSVSLKLAFRNHRPQPYDRPVAIIASRSRIRKLENPEHPINLLFPHRRVIASADDHRETVSSPLTASAIREALR